MKSIKTGKVKGFPDYKIGKKEKLKKHPTPFCFGDECGEKEEIEKIIGCKIYPTNSFSGTQLIEIIKKFKKITLQEVCEEMKKLREKLSNLEHEQWMSWSKYVAKNNEIPKELLEKWKKNWKHYSKLNEKTKDSDRIWADKIIKELLKKFQGEESGI